MTRSKSKRVRTSTGLTVYECPTCNGASEGCDVCDGRGFVITKASLQAIRRDWQEMRFMYREDLVMLGTVRDRVVRAMEGGYVRDYQTTTGQDALEFVERLISLVEMKVQAVDCMIREVEDMQHTFNEQRREARERDRVAAQRWIEYEKPEPRETHCLWPGCPRKVSVVYATDGDGWCKGHAHEVGLL